MLIFSTKVFLCVNKEEKESPAKKQGQGQGQAQGLGLGLRGKAKERKGSLRGGRSRERAKKRQNRWDVEEMIGPETLYACSVRMCARALKSVHLSVL
jgi:hypothetical protein